MNANAMTGAALRSQAGSSRILPIDAARGLVMLFSCLAHFAWWIHVANPDAGAALAGIGMVATPTFLMLSGAMVGMLCANGGTHGRDLKSQLFNRGLFLLTVGHLLIALTEAHLSGGFTRTLRGVTVVDEIGLCTLIAAFFIPKIANGGFCQRIATWAVLVLGIAWLYNVFWLPTAESSFAVEQVLIGGNIASTNLIAHTPVLQHMAIYALGLPLGHFFADHVAKRVSVQTMATRCVTLGLWLASAGFLLRMVRFLLDRASSFHPPALDFTLTITHKSPPSPAYLLFFGGCGLACIGVLFWLSASSRAWVRVVLEWVAVIGRASLLVFVLQYFLYWTLPDLLDIHPGKLSAVVFIGNVLLIRYVAGVWGRLRGNRWLTFGIKLGNKSPLRS